MRFAHRQLGRVLLVAVMIGVGVLTFHAAAHPSGDQPGCELCTSHANPLHALSPSPQRIATPAPAAVEFQLPAFFIGSPRLLSYESRAPPSFA